MHNSFVLANIARLKEQLKGENTPARNFVLCQRCQGAGHTLTFQLMQLIMSVIAIWPSVTKSDKTTATPGLELVTFSKDINYPSCFRKSLKRYGQIIVDRLVFLYVDFYFLSASILAYYKTGLLLLRFVIH